MNPRLSIIKSVRAVPRSRRVEITWSDKRVNLIDLALFIADFEVFAPLDNAAVFKKATVGEGGREITWGGDMSIAASTLRRLAVEQSPDATDADLFNAWMERNGLSASAAAEVLGVGRRTVIYYRTGQKPLPRVVGLACYGWETQSRHKAEAAHA